MIKIRYIGKKPSRADTLYGTGLVWSGFGDVQTCTDVQKAQRLLRHTDMFEDADAAPAAPPAPPLVELPVAQGLMGSNAFPSVVQISDQLSISLGDVVRAAQLQSGLTAAEWNYIQQPWRDTYIADTIDRARQLAAQRLAQQQAQQQPSLANVGVAQAAPATSAQVTAATAASDQPSDSGEQGGEQGEEGDDGGDSPVYRMHTENGPLLLNPLDKETLRKICRDVNLTVSNNAGEQTLRRKLAEAFPVVDPA